MIFAACHPALSVEARITLTLRYATGLSVPEIAAAFLAPPATIAQRLVRVKHKIRRAGIVFAVPDVSALSGRLNDILHVAYLIFNEGYASSTNASRVRCELCDEALGLARVLHDLLPQEPEVSALFALMLFHDARRRARVTALGEPVLLEHQDRSLWDCEKILRGISLLRRGVASSEGSYWLQAMIAAEHAQTSTWEATNWREICRLYDLLLAADPSPIIQLNRAVAVAYVQGYEASLALVNALQADGTLNDYAPLFSALAEMLQRTHRTVEARDAFERAIALTQSEPDRRTCRNDWRA